MPSTALTFAAYLSIIAAQSNPPPPIPQPSPLLLVPAEAVAIVSQIMVEHPAPANCRPDAPTPECVGVTIPCRLSIGDLSVQMLGVIAFGPIGLPSPDPSFTIIDQSLGRGFIIQLARPELIHSYQRASSVGGDAVPTPTTQDGLYVFAMDVRLFRICMIAAARRQSLTSPIPRIPMNP